MNDRPPDLKRLEATTDIYDDNSKEELLSDLYNLKQNLKGMTLDEIVNAITEILDKYIYTPPEPQYIYIYIIEDKNDWKASRIIV